MSYSICSAPELSSSSANFLIHHKLGTVLHIKRKVCDCTTAPRGHFKGAHTQTELEREGKTPLQFTPVQWAQDTCFAPDADPTVASAAAAAAAPFSPQRDL